MSSPIWTPAELSSEARPTTSRDAWRIVEAQHVISTMKLTDSTGEQEVLERLLEDTKPAIPEPCRHLDFLLAAPFRYRPYPQGSRFRRGGLTPGVFYASERPATAAAELAFYRLLFFAESPGTPWPRNAAEYTAFSVQFRPRALLDLTRMPLARDHAVWTHPTDYEPCQDLEVVARAAGVDCIRYESVRDPEHGANYALLTCEIFSPGHPLGRQSWRIFLDPSGARAVCEHPRVTLAFDRRAFAADPRIAAMRWVRP